MKILQTTLAAVALLVTSTMHANNVQVNNPSLTDNNGTSVQVQFDLSWENSWRGGGVSNWDAVWVFVKYRTSATGPWYHVNLNNTDHTPAPGSQIELGLLTPGVAYSASTNPAVGVFISRDVDGTGNMTLSNIQLNWNYAALGISYNDIVDVQVFAIEMVYVPQGAFAAGSGGTEEAAFTLTTINTAIATTAPAGVGSLGGQAGGYPTGQTAPSNANWPNGFSAFYCMKYELSKQGYADFLNTLTYFQQSFRTATSPNDEAGTGAMMQGLERTLIFWSDRYRTTDGHGPIRIGPTRINTALIRVYPCGSDMYRSVVPLFGPTAPLGVARRPDSPDLRR